MKRDVYKYRNWHLRCYICDRNMTMPESDYLNFEVPVEEGIKAGRQRKNTSRVGIDARTGRPICGECWRSIYDSIREMEWLDKL